MEHKEKKTNYPEYTFGNKKYIAIPELSKGACVGCAFYTQTNCSQFKERIELCQAGNIFMRKIKELDD